MALANRRAFLSRVGWLSLGIAIGASGYGAMSYLLSNNQKSSNKELLSIGLVSDYAVGDQKYIEPFYQVFRTASGFQAISALCTHEGCSIRPFVSANDDFSVVHSTCPCCGSVFEQTGEVVAGPAVRPLPFFAITMRGGQELLIDVLRIDQSDKYVLKSGRGISNRLYFNPATNQMEEGEAS